MLKVAIEGRLPGFELSVDFEHAGGVTALFGPSGAGKSLTLRAIAGAYRPDAGKIVLDKVALYDRAQRIDLPPEHRRVGYVPQHYALFPHLTVEENISFGVGSVSTAERRDRVDDLLDLLDLRDLVDRRPRALSGGQQQRVALARALAIRPRILLLDEPFAALDGPLRHMLRRELLSLHRRFTMPVVVVTHDLADAESLGATLVMLIGGRVHQIGSVADVVRHPASIEVARAVGARNLLSGKVVEVTSAGVSVLAGRLRLEAPPAPVRQGETVDVLIAPESVLLVRPERVQSSEDTGQGVVIAGEIIERTVQGPIHVLSWQATGAPAGSIDLEIHIAAGPYNDLGVGRRADWHVKVPRSAVTILSK